MAGYRGKDLAYLWLDDAIVTPALTSTDKLLNTKGDLSIAVTIAEIDVVDDASAGNYEFIPGDITATITGSFNYLKAADATSTVQHTLIDAAYAKTKLDLAWAYETLAATGVDYEATGYVTDISSTNGDPEVLSFTIKVTGAITKGTQPA